MSEETSETDIDDKELSSTWTISFKYGGALFAAATLWLNLIGSEVAGVYLDEEFHVRQALVYADNRFSVWDPKITTPPGLYLVAYVWLWIFRTLRIPGSPVTHLRSLNVVGLLGLWFVAWELSDAIQVERQPKDKTDSAERTERRNKKRYQMTAHVAVNAALFPPLCFFSGLFYTDVLSALFVLLAHLAFYKRNVLGVFIAGSCSLFLRQTNIFWTGIYLAGLEASRQLRRLDASRRGRRKPVGLLTWTEVARLSWNEGALYDPAAHEASVEEYLKCGLSLGLAAVANIQSLMLPLAPYILLLGGFTAFVVINGGVVLGDKSNHVASLHVPQMLYIWPCFVLFTFASLLMNVLLVAAALLQRFYPSMVEGGEWNMPDAARLPRLWVLAAFTALAGAAVHFNTIVHPFILADNRHYTFYVFRLLLRHPAIKYAATPVYVVCAWLCLSVGVTGFEARKKSATASTSTSVMLIWLLATAGSLVTAPLVEPRYFIIPWLVWRLNLHIPPIEDHQDWDENDKGIANIEREMLGYETNWSIILNLVIAYVFLYWRFEWPGQPGQIMRFMW